MFTDDLCSLRWDPVSEAVEIIDQTLLPHTLCRRHLDTLPDFCHAISSMQVRGAPLIGVTAAFGLVRSELFLEMNEAILARDPARALRLVEDLATSGQSLDEFARGVVTNFRNKLDEAGADWEMNTYGGVRHGFMNAEAAAYGMHNLEYNAQADQDSWQRMQRFFDTLY